MKTPLAQIDSIVVDELVGHYTTAHLLVPLPQYVYNALWAVIRPEDRWSYTPELYDIVPAHLCSGKGAPIYVAEGYTAGAGDPMIMRLPIDVVSSAVQESVLARLVQLLENHPWLATTPRPTIWARMCQKVGL